MFEACKFVTVRELLLFKFLVCQDRGALSRQSIVVAQMLLGLSVDFSAELCIILYFFLADDCCKVITIRPHQLLEVTVG